MVMVQGKRFVVNRGKCVARAIDVHTVFNWRKRRISVVSEGGSRTRGEGCASRVGVHGGFGSVVSLSEREFHIYRATEVQALSGTIPKKEYNAEQREGVGLPALDATATRSSSN